QVVGIDINPTRNLACNEFIVADITRPLAPIPGLDAVIHLAAIANPRECDANPSKAFDVNVNGTHQVLKMALASGAKKVVFSSSAHVYDIPPRYLPTDEVHPLRLNNTYTTSKILGEQLCELFWTNHGLSYTVLRLYNAYGPGQAKGYFVPDMLAKRGNIDLGVGAHTTKDWVWIEDVAQAFLLAVESPFVGPINIGTGIEAPLHVLAGQIAMDRGFVCTTAANDNATRMQADITRAKKVLGWTPTVAVAGGLERILRAERVKVKA
ncbi:MAG: NAD(P)-dependent oxidoreductase, partial [Patescibacteria group bacterium]